ncbi:hypothetical protein CBW65_08895 [Tumebacillus avium]|uniref:Uncharacterized protein n=1 Tax=Tumebacillus avium TaxID=1903704 RepID=A0A1Y0IP75_9BACL|nr:hypothetical protein [Tumebacillus avium]ARU61134.1 hypothetical protein CBW65_08895 [Tumebacillus avium]
MNKSLLLFLAIGLSIVLSLPDATKKNVAHDIGTEPDTAPKYLAHDIGPEPDTAPIFYKFKIS